MIYDNCIKYIYDEMDEISKKEDLKNCNCVIWGIDSLAKCIVAYLRDIGNSNIRIFDDEQVVDTYSDIIIEKENVDIDNVTIFVTVKSYLNKVNQMELDKKNCKIIDLTYLRMDTYFPNPIKPKDNISTLSLRECQLAQVPLLDDLHRVCIKHNLRYCFDYGTLLGAVRHKGFIPWDDDLDVAMPIYDYLKFCDIYSEEGQFFFDSHHNLKNDNLPISVLARIKHKQIATEYVHLPLRTMTGVGIDVFPLVGFPDSEKEQDDYVKLFAKWGDIWKEKVIIPFGTEKYSREEHLEICHKMEEVLLKYDYETANYVGPAYFGLFPIASYNKRALPKKAYDPVMYGEFEEHQYYIPQNYQLSLTKWYGDYMQLPPEEKRVPHNSNGFYRMEYGS